MANERSSWGIVWTVVILGAACSGIALAQDASSAPAGNDQGAAASQEEAPAASATTAESGETPQGSLQEVVVTATHFATAINDTPLTISADTVSQLNQQGINTFADLVGTVPTLQISSSQGTGIANVAIRGIIQNGPGAATTGFYLDNVPLQLRNNSVTANDSGNGTPLPPIFDLQRVEVLEGPQGTLFGASSEGGTIRYITPTPDLQNFHVYTKMDGSRTDDAQGDNYDAGLAVGGPIIPGVLGFRASVYTSHNAGYINMEDPLSQQVFAHGLNSTNVQEFHGSLLWEPTKEFSAQASLFYSYQSTPYWPTSYDKSEPYQIVQPELGFNITPTTKGSGPAPVCVGAAACSAYSGPITYLRPAATYGPYNNLGPYTVMGSYQQAIAPASTSIYIPSLNLTYNFPSFTAQLFNSMMRQETKQNSVDTVQLTSAVDDAQEGPNYVPEGLTFCACAPELGYNTFTTVNLRNTVSEDLRFTSLQGPSQRGAHLLSWTGGLYYEHDWENGGYLNEYPTGFINTVAEDINGETALQRWSTNPLTYNATTEGMTTNQESFSDTNAAVYGEANYNVTSNLQATVGLRQSLVTYTFYQAHYGPTAGFDVPSFANGGLATGSETDKPFTPKAELTYRFSNDKLMYVLADKGFRPGGANTPLPAAVCGPAAAQYGLTTLSLYQLTQTYKPDTDWNYEVGTKLGLANGRVQLNGDAYRIEWSQVQTSQSAGFGCGSQFTANAGHAISQGMEISGQALPLRALAVNWAAGFDHAYYTENAIAVQGPARALVVADEGQDFPVAPWTVDLGARLDFGIAFGITSFDPYLRADWHDSGGFNVSQYPLGAYAPDANSVPALPMLNLRAGVTMGAVDVNLYALNALDSTVGAETGGRTGCTSAACTSYSSYAPFIAVAAPPPMTVGLQFTYNH